MASGMLTKQADLLSIRTLNSVNDSAAGGAVASVPAGAAVVASSQTLPGDRIVIDDATALALSATTIGTLYGGVYMYYGTLSTATAAPARGTIAFFRAADVGGTGSIYQVTSDAQPSTTVPTYIAGIFINAITKGNWGWVQVSGLASVLFDSASLTAIAAGDAVGAKVSATTASTADVGTTGASTVTLAALLGVAVGAPVSATISSVMLTRGLFCGRI